MRVYCGGYEEDARVALAAGWSTHVLNYVNAKHFGSAYPNLLWAHRGILGEPGPRQSEEVEEATQRGISVRVRPSQWTDVQLTDCGASMYACGARVRSFDDRAALRARMNPRDGDPLASNVMWRMTVMPCGGPCLGKAHSRGMKAHSMYRVL